MQSHNNGKVIERELLSRILEILHVLSKGVIVELISSFTNNCLKTLCAVSSTHEIFSAAKIFQASVRSVASIVPFILPACLSRT